MVLLFAVGATCFWLVCLSCFELVETEVGIVPLTAYCTDCGCCALVFVVTEPLTVEAPQRFFVVSGYLEAAPHSQVDLLGDGSLESANYCFGRVPCL